MIGWRLGKTSTPPQCRRSSVGRARSVPGADPRRWFKSNRLHQIQCSCEVQAERASGDRAQEGSRNVYLSGLTASSRHAAVTAGKDRHPPHADVAQSVRAPRRVDAVGSSPTVCTIGVTSCLAAARSVSLRKWSFLCAVRKRQDEVIYVLAGTGFVKMNGCDRRTGAGLKSSVVGSGAGVCGENPRRNL